MSDSPIPQLVNISHALQSSLIQQIRTELKEFTEAPQLSPEQSEKVDRYISSLESAFADFTRDNEHIERRDDHVTSADVQLYTGLKTMYTDYLSQLIKLKRSKVNKEEQVDSDNPIEYICDELPYKQPNERKQYLDNLILTNRLQLGKSDELLQGIIDLSILDSTVNDNLKSYIAFLKFVGYSQDEISANMPNFRVDKAEHGLKPTSFSQAVDIVPESSFQEREAVDTDEDTKRILDSSEEPKKKISFSKYLKKGDTNDQNKRPLQFDENYSSVKRLKPSVESSSLLNSILKGDNNSIKKKKLNSIRFVDDDNLVTIYGDELPSEGLVVSPQKLKKILKPFKDGEPREKLLSAWTNQRVRELLIPEAPDDSDIVDLKGGPISCESRVPLIYRLNFTAFNRELNKPSKEPIAIDETMNDSAFNQKKPLIARAFGKNALLLKKDRGGVPYKRVPEITRNDYPPRPSI